MEWTADDKNRPIAPFVGKIAYDGFDRRIGKVVRVDADGTFEVQFDKVMYDNFGLDHTPYSGVICRPGGVTEPIPAGRA